MERIIEYISKKYSPLSIFVYGSFAKGNNDEKSDFDAMIIVQEKSCSYDNNIIDNTPLDLFIYSIEEIENIKDYSRFVTVYNSILIKDTDNIGHRLYEKVKGYINEICKKNIGEKEHLSHWIKKMLERAKREDIEGRYRYHWLLTDSLEIYCIFSGIFYSGVKDTIEYIKDNDEKGFQLLDKALNRNDIVNLQEWCEYILKK